MNILITNRCNRRCPYCFAQGRVSYDGSEEDDDRSAETPQFISSTDFLTALSYARRGKQRVVGILGGEPSLHPSFPELLVSAWSQEIRTKIFTNGLWREEQIDELETLAKRFGGDERIHIVVNLNEPSRTPPEERARQEALLERLGTYCGASFNISRADFDPFFLPDVIDAHDMRRDIRLGLAQPLARARNEHISIDDYPDTAPTLARFAQACDGRDIRLGFDCGFTLCMFTAEQLGQLVIAGARFRSKCGPVLDIGTDLTAWACFPLSTFSSGVHLESFSGLEELDGHFRERFRGLYTAGALDECLTCRHRKRKQCTGGCAAHVYRRLNP